MRLVKEAKILISVKGYRDISNFILHTYIFILQIWVQSAFYKFESSPRFTSPVQFSPVPVLQNALIFFHYLCYSSNNAASSHYVTTLKKLY